MAPVADQWLREGEQELVYEWRLHELGEMRDLQGDKFNPRQARVLAGEDCDLHDARALLLSGCRIDTAYKILR